MTWLALACSGCNLLVSLDEKTPEGAGGAASASTVSATAVSATGSTGSVGGAPATSTSTSTDASTSTLAGPNTSTSTGVVPCPANNGEPTASSPQALRPFNGAYTGSWRAQAQGERPGLHPVFAWVEQDQPGTYVVEVARADSVPSCTLPAVCEFPEGSMSEAAMGSPHRLVNPLPLDLTASSDPGTRFYWHVRRVNDCAWSRTRWFEAGRAPNDLNGDGFSDLAIGHSQLAGNGDSGIGRFWVFQGGPAGPSTSGAWIAGELPSSTPRFTGLGFGDAASFDGDGDGVASLAGATKPAATPTAELALFANASSPGALRWEARPALAGALGAPSTGLGLARAGDLDADGVADLVAASFGEGLVVLRGSTGPMPAAVVLPALAGDSTGQYAGVAALGDVDGDGFADVAATRNAGTARLVVYRGAPTGALASSAGVALDDGLSGFGATAAGFDADDDGFGDFVVAGDTPVLKIVFGGPKPFDVPKVNLIQFEGAPAFAKPRVRSAGDVDGDGRGDLVVRARNGSVMGVIWNARLSTSSGPDEFEQYVLETDGGPFLDAAGVGDVDGDGFDDVAVSQASMTTTCGYNDTATVFVLRGSPEGIGKAQPARYVVEVPPGAASACSFGTTIASAY